MRPAFQHPWIRFGGCNNMASQHDWTVDIHRPPRRHSTRRANLWARWALMTLALFVLAPASGAQNGAAGDAVSGTLSVDVSEARDAQIREALVRRLRRIQGLESLEVDVDAGVVTLRGVAANPDAADEAVALARRTEGVATVVSEITEDWRIRQRVGPVLYEGRTRVERFISYLPLATVALVVVLLFTALSRLVGRWDALFARLSRNRFLQDQLRQAVRIVVFVIGVLIALELLNATALVGALLGAAGVIGLALGFAFRDLVENHIASVLLSLRQPFSPNDHVMIGDHEGKVIRLTSRATILMTLDGNHLRIPNADVYKGVILNYTRNPHRSFSVAASVGISEDLQQVQRLGVGVLASMSAIERDPPPSGMVEELGNGSALLRFFGWVDQRQHNFYKVKSEAVRQIKEALEEAGIDMSEPTYRVLLKGGGVAPEAVEAPGPHPPFRPPRPPKDTGPVDLAAGDSVDEQIARERAETQDRDLLDASAPKE